MWMCPKTVEKLTDRSYEKVIIQACHVSCVHFVQLTEAVFTPFSVEIDVSPFQCFGSVRKSTRKPFWIQSQEKERRLHNCMYVLYIMLYFQSNAGSLSDCLSLLRLQRSFSSRVLWLIMRGTTSELMAFLLRWGGGFVENWEQGWGGSGLGRRSCSLLKKKKKSNGLSWFGAKVNVQCSAAAGSAGLVSIGNTRIKLRSRRIYYWWGASVKNRSTTHF